MPKEQFLSYQKENHHPSQPPVLDAVGSVLNALCVTKGYTWKEAYCKLIAVAGKIGQMPQYPKTIRELSDMLTDEYLDEYNEYAGVY